jgi:hypothetical protein
MKVYDLFQSCDKQKLYKSVKLARNLTKLSEEMFSAKLDMLLKNFKPTFSSQYYAVFTPYFSTNGSGMEHDLFLLSADDVSAHMRAGRTPQQVLLFTTRILCDSVPANEVLNAEVFPLSKTNFSEYDICTEIFLETMMDITELQEYTKEEAVDFIRKIKEQLKMPPHPTTDDDIEHAIAQNVIFAYPYYASVVNDAE